MQCAVRQTSRDRFWTEFDALIFHSPCRVVERPFFKDHHVSMAVGAPIRAMGRFDSLVSRCLQVPGDKDERPTKEMGAISNRVSIAPQLHGIPPGALRDAV
jgi:hypothetical protein